MKSKMGATLPLIFSLVMTGCQTNTNESVNSASLNISDYREVAYAFQQLDFSLGEPAQDVVDHRIDNWSILNDRNVIISAGVTQHYLVTFLDPCPGAELAIHMRFDKFGRFLNRNDRVILHSVSQVVGVCRILDMYHLEPLESTNQQLSSASR